MRNVAISKYKAKKIINNFLMWLRFPAAQTSLLAGMTGYNNRSWK
jgi:hypothetical protein